MCLNFFNSPCAAKKNNAFRIKGHPLYIGSAVNNALKNRESSNQQHGDTGHALWDTSLLMAKLLERHAFTREISKDAALDVSGLRVLFLWKNLKLSK